MSQARDYYYRINWENDGSIKFEFEQGLRFTKYPSLFPIANGDFLLKVCMNYVDRA